MAKRPKLYVMGPLELSPGHFAVGERSYEAIKGKMPLYNKLRLALECEGRKAEADAIGELEARAVEAERSEEETQKAWSRALLRVEVADHLERLCGRYKRAKKAQMRKLRKETK